MERLTEMDAKGILPYELDSVDSYLYRAYRMLTLAEDPAWVHQFMKNQLPEIAQDQGYAATRFPAPDHVRVRAFRDGIRQFGQMTHTDLSWVPVFGFSDLQSKGSLGISLQRRCGEAGVHMRIMGVNWENPLPWWMDNVRGTGSHEAFHTIRYPIQDSGVEAEEYGHLGGRLIEWGFRWMTTGPVEKAFLHAWLKLRWYFGKDTWYVLARLSYAEIVENILGKFQGHNPREYLRWAAQHHLRERIMCHRLGL